MNPEILQSIKPPPEAYNFTPPQYRIKLRESSARLIFENNVTSIHEEKLLNQILLANLPGSWTKGHTLRYLYANDMDVEKTKKAIVSHLRFKELHPLDTQVLFCRCCKMLEQNYMYIHGRDVQFRPIIVINIKEFDLSYYLVDEYIELILFYMELIVNQMLIPRKIENIVVIFNMQRFWFRDIGVHDIQKVLIAIMSNYPNRLYKFYIFKPPSIILKLMKWLPTQIPKLTMDKIIIEGNSRILKTLLNHCAPNQLEVKFGGTQPNVSSSWPPTLPPGPFDVMGTPTPSSRNQNYSTDNTQIFVSARPKTKSTEISVIEHELFASPRMGYLTERPKLKIQDMPDITDTGC